MGESTIQSMNRKQAMVTGMEWACRQSQHHKSEEEAKIKTVYINHILPVSPQDIPRGLQHKTRDQPVEQEGSLAGDKVRKRSKLEKDWETLDYTTDNPQGCRPDLCPFARKDPWLSWLYRDGDNDTVTCLNSLTGDLFPIICCPLHAPLLLKREGHLEKDYIFQQALLFPVVTWLRGLTCLNKPEPIPQSFHFFPLMAFLLGLMCPKRDRSIILLTPSMCGSLHQHLHM